METHASQNKVGHRATGRTIDNLLIVEFQDDLRRREHGDAHSMVLLLTGTSGKVRIQTGEAAGRLATSLALDKGLPADVAELGVSEAALSPARFALTRQ